MSTLTAERPTAELATRPKAPKRRVAWGIETASPGVGVRGGRHGFLAHPVLLAGEHLP